MGHSARIMALTVEQARAISIKVEQLVQQPEIKAKLEAAAAQVKEQCPDGDPATKGPVIAAVFTPVVLETLGDVLSENGLPADQGGVMMLGMGMMAHAQDPE